MKKFKNTKIQNITKPLALLLTTSLLIASVTACGKTTANTDATAEIITDVSTEYDLNSETSDKSDKKATTEASDKTASTEAESKADTTATPVVASAKQTASTERRAVATTERQAATTTERQTTAPSAPTTEAPAPAPTPEQPKHEHTWVDVYKTVVDKEAYDEQVLVGYEQKQVHHQWSPMLKKDTLENLGWKDTYNMSWDERRAFEEANGLSPMCLEGWYDEYEMVDDPTKPIYQTVHHDAVTHQELDYTYCTGCGKRK